jgi:hypothetical protein
LSRRTDREGLQRADQPARVDVTTPPVPEIFQLLHGEA